MKKMNNSPFLITLALLFMAFSFSSCLKDSNREEIPAAGVAFIHASPGVGTLDFVDYNNYSVPVLSRLNYNMSAVYPAGNDETTPYRAFYPGSRTFAVALAGSNYYFNIKQMSLIPNKVYSIFSVDTGKNVMLYQLQDSIKSIDSTQVAVRFINLSPDSDKLKLAIGSSMAPTALTPQAFKEHTDYVAVAPSENYTLSLTEAGVQVAKRENVTLKKGGIYNIWARGLKAASDSTKVNISVMKTK